MNIWLVIVLVGVVSLVLRASSLVLLRNYRLPERVTSLLGLVPAAALSALIAPELVVHAGHAQPFGPRLVAGVVAGLVAWKTRSVLWTLIVGLGLLALAQILHWPGV